MKQHEISTPTDLLDSRGELIQKGWARDLILNYHRSQIKASRFRIKEWDYYCILSESVGVSFTFSDLGYLGFIAATLFDFGKGEEVSDAITTLFPMGKFNLPPSSKQGDVVFCNKKLTLRYLLVDGNRIIEVHWKKFAGGVDLVGRIALQQNETDDTMVIATPFSKNPRAFYYNQKINCMPASGEIQWGNRTLKFSDSDSFGVLDWGRGVWTYANTWYWGSASGLVGGHRFGFNIGYGFGDTTAATENMLFYNGRAHKLDQIEFHIPPDDFLKPWRFSSNDGRLELDFVPIIDRHSNTDVLLIKSWQHQVFGRFSGVVLLDNGEKLQLQNFLGFAEKVINRW